MYIFLIVELNRYFYLLCLFLVLIPQCYILRVYMVVSG